MDKSNSIEDIKKILNLCDEFYDKYNVEFKIEIIDWDEGKCGRPVYGFTLYEE